VCLRAGFLKGFGGCLAQWDGNTHLRTLAAAARAEIDRFQASLFPLVWQRLDGDAQALARRELGLDVHLRRSLRRVRSYISVIPDHLIT
jgi:hypothetical protein